MCFCLITGCGGSGNWTPPADAPATPAANRQPVADAGLDNSIMQNTMVTLSGGGSFDPGGDAITYLWSQISGPSTTLSADTVANPTFTPAQAGTYVFQLVVNDGTIDSAADSVTVTVSAPPVNRQPVADAGLDSAIMENTLLTLSGAGSLDPDGDAITYLWSQISGPAIALSAGTVVNPAFTPAQAGTYVFQLVVNDGALDSAADSVTVTVTAPSPDVDGTVTLNGVPVPDAVIRIYNDGYSEITITDANGYYAFYNVPLGTYYLVATRENSTLKSDTVTVP